MGKAGPVATPDDETSLVYLLMYKLRTHFHATHQ